MSSFVEQLEDVALTAGMPGIRIQWIKGPVWGKTAEQLRKDVVLGNSPVTGEQVLQGIVDKLTSPLTEEEKRTGEVIRSKGPETFGNRCQAKKMRPRNRAHSLIWLRNIV